MAVADMGYAISVTVNGTQHTSEIEPGLVLSITSETCST